MAKWTLVRELNPDVQDQNPNSFGRSPTGDIYVIQSDRRDGTLEDVEDLTVSRFTSAGYVAKMDGLFGHGGNMLVERTDTDYILYEYFVTNTTTGKITDKQWVRLPFIPGKTWTQAEALTYKTNTPPFPTNVKKGSWFQSYTLAFAGNYYLLHGSPSSESKPVQTRVDIARGGKVVGTLPGTYDLGRDDKGKPLRGRLEAEGASLWRINGTMSLIVGIVTGDIKKGRRLRLYSYPLEAAVPSQPDGGASFNNGRASFVAPYTRRANPPGTLARFVVCDTLTNKVIGELRPSTWELTDPVKGGAGFGTLTIALPRADDPDDPLALPRLRKLTLPRVRWVAAMDTNGNVIWSGPIIKPPARQGGTVTVSMVDWRGWFYRTYLRPTSTGGDGGYIAKNVEQATIMKNLITKAWTDTATAPILALDAVTSTGIKRDFTGAQLDRTTGEMLDDLAGRERGAEWFTYAVASAGGSYIQPHVRLAYPERMFRQRPFRADWVDGVAGNIAEISWPDAEETSTRVWAQSSGEPPAVIYAVDQYPEIKAGSATDILWENKIGPIDGVTKAVTAFEYAYAAVERSRNVAGQAEISITEEKLLFGSYEVGDRVHIIVNDGWNGADIPAARIVQRVLSGGRGQPTMQRLTLDLDDAHYPDDGNDPGEGLSVDVPA